MTKKLKKNTVDVVLTSNPTYSRNESDGQARLRFLVKEYDGCSPKDMLDAILVKYRDVLKEWIECHFYVEDCETYEGGIDCWWGMGSVTICELGMRFSFHYSDNGVGIFIKT